jgi:hypothetical protein
MPTVIAAAPPHEDAYLYESGVGDSRGYISDGAYIGRSIVGEDETWSESDPAIRMIEPQAAYTEALKQRFQQQHDELHQPAEPEAVAALSQQHPTRFRVQDNKNYAQWVRIVKTVAPLPDQIRAMDQRSVFELLQLIQRMYLCREEDIKPVTSAWIWSLLARLDEVGLMDEDAVFEVRDFGKRAIIVQVSLHDPAAAKDLEKRAGATAGELLAAKASEKPAEEGAKVAEKRDGNESSVERQNTLATLDMIITIVGDIFGQRDLLEARRPWEKEEQEAEAEGG